MKNKNVIKNYLVLGTTAFMFLCASNTSFGKEYYKWVDSKGTTHYTTTPPPKTAKKRGKIDTYGYRTNPSATQANPQTPPPQNPPTNNQNQPPQANTTPSEQPSMDLQQREANAALRDGAVERADLR